MEAPLLALLLPACCHCYCVIYMLWFCRVVCCMRCVVYRLLCFCNLALQIRPPALTNSKGRGLLRAALSPTGVHKKLAVATPSMQASSVQPSGLP